MEQHEVGSKCAVHKQVNLRKEHQHATATVSHSGDPTVWEDLQWVSQELCGWGADDVIQPTRCLRV